MAQLMRPISTITDEGNYTGPTAHGSVDGTAPDTGDYWNGQDNQDDILEVLLTDLSATEPGAGTCTVSIYETDSDTDSAPAGSAGTTPTYDLYVYEGATQRASRTGITPTTGTFTLDNALTFSVSAITDWSDIRVRFVSHGTGGNPGNRRGAAVSYIDISAPDAPASVTATETAQTSTADTPALTQHNIAAATETSQTSIADTSALTQHNIVAATETAQTSVSDAPAATSSESVSLVETAQTSTADTPALTQHYAALTATETAQTSTADTPALTQHNIAAATETAQTSTAGTPTAAPAVVYTYAFSRRHVGFI